ncbi:unnamed protein product [Parascedosporium putredinis]|uniref:Uncharacterized protein n=1 Tax=Parascedosporium putredinis TaxID=1442378 RepID=A0A9P1GV60_9PEZI|nr:unnamed protein product [Parascedosporium putredinis]CAI7987933.1 unnamed protein product [Parascedosporium putredinis]
MPVVKGGVWTNIEDEILKASVSKYGLNQWARVSSLLARKTPKQCKARWNEWLDPSIKKIEWSREEDEKLLHIAKLMPTQWKTIAHIVGRTANQCLERYQKLLDEAEAREGLSLTGADSETAAPTAEDVRKLRPGELDPDPETRPARPDTIDLDEDEKEMLSEARARLANTQGKKAKRKARERQQEESRRLATLQKRRELKAAGINVKITTRKKGQMDYNADIPFEKKAAPGFYDTNDEMSRNEHQREDESSTDRKRRKDDKDGQSASTQAAIKAGQMQRIREAEQSSKRRALVLPTPQVSDGELEEIVKMGVMGERASMTARESENAATRGLISDYTTLNTSAPIRTPMAPLRRITSRMKYEISELLPRPNPSHRDAKPLATPLRTAQNGVGATPARRRVLGISHPRDVKMHNLAVRQQLRQGLSSLPKPKDSEWELELPEEQADIGDGDEVQEEDAAERDRRERDIREAREALERRRRTQEAAALMAHDAVKYPVQGIKVVGKAPALQTISDDALAEAGLQIMLETPPIPSLEDIQKSFEARSKNAILLGLGCYEDDDDDVKVAAVTQTFNAVQDEIQLTAEQNAKLEKKLALHFGGYQKRQKVLRDRITQVARDIVKAENALGAFKTLAVSEEVTISRRLETLAEEVSFVSRREREAQEEYRRLRDELAGLTAGTNGVY